MAFLALVLALGILSGATASVAGFGIGSIMTPLLATSIGMNVAVAAVSIPHAVATSLRCWRLRRSINARVLRAFGLLSALGALGGALLYTRFSSRTLTLILGLLLITTAIAGLTGVMRRLAPNRAASAALGVASGLFGGVAGNQGGLRAGAMFAFDLTPAAFVATSTAVGLLVDAARMPVYVWRAGGTLVPHMTLIGVATVGVVIGTLAGERALLGLSAQRFRRIVAATIGVLGVWLLIQAMSA